MESKDQAKRPNPYKSQIEIEAIKATNKALKVGKDVTNKVAKNVFDSKSEMGRFGVGGWLNEKEERQRIHNRMRQTSR